MTTKTILSDCCQAEVKEASEPEQMLGVPDFFCGKCGKDQPTPAQDWEEEFDNKKLGCCFNYNCRFNTSDNHNQKLKSFISTQITEAEKRGAERERKEIYDYLLLKEAQLGVNNLGDTEYFRAIDDVASYINSIKN